MKLQLVAKLLRNTDGIRNSGYVAFSLSIFGYFFYAWHSVWLYLSLSCIFLLCLLQHYLSIRLRFDADVLELLTTSSQTEDELQLDHKTILLDQSLVELKLIPSEKCARPWQDRLAGCMRLFKLHVMVVVCQYIVLLTLMIFLLQQE